MLYWFAFGLESEIRLSGPPSSSRSRLFRLRLVGFRMLEEGDSTTAQAFALSYDIMKLEAEKEMLITFGKVISECTTKVLFGSTQYFEILNSPKTYFRESILIEMISSIEFLTNIAQTINSQRRKLF